MCVLPPALDDFPALQVRNVKEKDLFELSPRRRVAPAVHFHEAEAAVGEKRPRGSLEQAPVYGEFEPKDNDEVAHQQLPSKFAISFEARMA